MLPMWSVVLQELNIDVCDVESLLVQCILDKYVETKNFLPVMCLSSSFFAFSGFQASWYESRVQRHVLGFW